MDTVIEFLGTPTAAQILGVSRRTLEKWRVVGGGPRFRKFGRAVRYARADLHEWAEEQARVSTSDTEVSSNKGP